MHSDAATSQGRRPACAKHRFLFFCELQTFAWMLTWEKPIWQIAANMFTSPVHTSANGWCANDPSAGSPTETLLRLLLPLSDKVH